MFTADLGPVQQWRSNSIQGAYRIELQRLQHLINFIIAHSGKELTERQSTGALQSLQDRIKTCRQIHLTRHFFLSALHAFNDVQSHIMAHVSA